jgi:hypothetical protein
MLISIRDMFLNDFSKVQEHVRRRSLGTCPFSIATCSKEANPVPTFFKP